MRPAIVLWVLGLLTAVPYATYHLLFHAPQDQYALLIVGILSWVFGYWVLVGPLLLALKVRRVMRALERAPHPGIAREVLASQDAEQVFVDLIAVENGIPKFAAAWVHRRLVAHLWRGQPVPRSGPPRPL